MEGDWSGSDNWNKHDLVTDDFTKPMNLYEFSDMEETAMVFCENDDNSWKFVW